MKYQLFVSGTPGDYELFPQGDVHAAQYCKQFFNLPANEIPHSEDYYVELFPTDKMAYYSLVRRRNVRSTRQNAYIALTLRFSEGYCYDLKSILSLLKSVYNNNFLGNVIEQSIGNDERFRFQSLAASDNIRSKAEIEIGEKLNILSNSIKLFDTSIPPKRQPATKSIWHLEDNEELLVKELKYAQKLHLIPISDEYEGMLSNANTTINNLQSSNIELNGKIGILNENLDKANQVLYDREKAYSDLNRKYKDLEEQLKKTPKPTSEDVFKSQVLSKLAGIENKITNMQSNTGGVSSSGQKNDTHNVPDWKKHLPWGLLFIALVLLIIAGIKIFNDANRQERSLLMQNEKYAELRTSYEELQKKMSKQNKEYAELQALYEELQQEYEVLIRPATNQGKRTALPQYTREVPSERSISSNPFSIGGKEDTKFFTEKSYKLTYKEKPKGFDHWVIVEGEAQARIINDKLQCDTEGSISIGGADKQGNLLEGFVRTIQIERKNN